MTDALRTPGSGGPLPRPPESGPGSGVDKWQAYAAQETGRALEGDLDQVKERAVLIALVDHVPPKEDLRKAPEGVDVYEAETDKHGRERPPALEGEGGPQWVVPVEGPDGPGYAAEDDLLRAECERQAEEKKRRHEEAVAQLRQRG